MIVGGSKCQFADGDCRGRLEWHHAVKQQRLKREFPRGVWRYGPTATGEPWKPIGKGTTLNPHMRVCALNDILGDTRNRVWLCTHHHERVTNGRLKVQLPESVWEFCDEFGLRGMLENDLRRAA